MSTVNPRLNVVLEPSLYEALKARTIGHRKDVYKTY